MRCVYMNHPKPPPRFRVREIVATVVGRTGGILIVAGLKLAQLSERIEK